MERCRFERRTMLVYNQDGMWTKMMAGPRKKSPRTIAVIDPDRCFGAFACSICQAACPVADCIIEVPDNDGRMVCAVRADLCIGCGLCVTLGNPTAPQPREFGCPGDYDAITMVPFDVVVKAIEAEEKGQPIDHERLRDTAMEAPAPDATP
jgi:ferredoxin